jgi:hypothetical protein
MYVITHIQNILFLNNLFGKTYITNCGSPLAFSFAKKICWQFGALLLRHLAFSRAKEIDGNLAHFHC